MAMHSRFCMYEDNDIVYIWCIKLIHTMRIVAYCHAIGKMKGESYVVDSHCDSSSFMVTWVFNPSGWVVDPSLACHCVDSFYCQHANEPTYFVMQR